jgi:hypothetical protein
MRATLICLATLIAVPVFCQERPLPEAQGFLREVRSRLQPDEVRQSDYAYVETRKDQTLDKSGRPTRETVTVYESYPALPGEARWLRLISKNGVPVPAAELAKKDRERQEHVLKYARRIERQTDRDRAAEARRREKARRENEANVDEAFRVYDIRMLGREALGGYDTIVFSFAPKPGARPRTKEGKVLRHFAGKMWVSETEHEPVRLEVEVLDTASFGLGLVRVHQGSHLAFERRKVNGEEWLPASASYTASARVLLLKRVRVSATMEFSDYRKFTVATETTVAPPK